ncbi:MAG TPA: CoA-binding protein [Armatimonadota bacterium]|jgi:predicted CoA-binding protein
MEDSAKRTPSSREQFWEQGSYAVIGHTGSKRHFPLFTYRGLKSLGKTVYAVDPGAREIGGDPAYPDLSALPAPVEAAVLELPKDEVLAWVGRAADAGVRGLWFHDGTETPEALALAASRGLRVETGACAVMYVTPGFTFHSIHKWICQVTGKY